MTRRKTNGFLLAALAFLLVFCSAFTAGQSIGVTYAAESKITYSGVLDDLQKDGSFDESFYPVSEGDYSLKLIQIAESADGELFLYVYQPSGQAKNLKASSINISTTINDEISYRNYKVRLLNSSGVFYKYIVQDFAVLSEPTRYYAISSIYRPFDESIDNQAEHGNTVAEVNYPVNKQYCFSEINGKPYCNVVDIETITITDKFVGFVRYMDGFKLYVGACDSHFVAFNTDKPIDKLLEADVYYTTQKYSYSFVPFAGENETFGEKSDEYAYLKYTDKVEHSGGGLFAGTYKWDRIETVEQFIAENDLTQNVYSGAVIDVNVANKITDEGKAALRGKKWVLRFAETSYSLNSGAGSVTSFSTMVGDVTILRLKFETDGITYNLGVIDNKQTGGDKPINEEEIKPEINERGKWIIIAVILIVALILLAPLLPTIISFIGKLIVWIFKGLWWLISAPFRLIKTIIEKIREKRG